MSNVSLSAFRTDVSILVVDRLPFQSMDTARILVEDYISATGGWVPDNAGDPTGPGVPASGENQDQMATSVKNEQIARIYNVGVDANIKINMDFVTKLTVGLTDEQVSAAIEDSLKTFIEQQLASTALEFVDMNSFTGTVIADGFTTQAVRVIIKDNVNNFIDGTIDKLIDSRDIALWNTRQRYGLDDTFNVTYIFTETDNDLVFQIEKYVSSMENLDVSDPNIYIITLDPADYKVTSGIIRQR